MYDLVFENVRLMDGSGSDSQLGSLAILGGKIAA